MYAKLVVGGSNITALGAIRDIGRLITSESPSTSLLGAFNSSSSIIVDNTPAGWTYVGSVQAADQPTIASVGTSTAQTADVNYNLCFSAPCKDTNALKYCTLTNVWRSTTGYLIALAGATNATSNGVLTNEGPRRWQANVDGSNAECLTLHMSVAAGKILHVIATPRHITIIEEGRGIHAIWEASQTDAHTFYGTAPFIQYTHGDTSNINREAIIVPAQSSVTSTSAILTGAFDITDPNSGTYYGTYDFTDAKTVNTWNLVQAVTGTRTNTITSTGAPRYVVSPAFFTLTTKGYPTQYVTGIVPVYFTGAGIGSSGDIVDINGDSYTFFNCGTGFGVVLKTS